MDFETADENEDDDHPKISDESRPEMNAIVEPVKDDEDELPWQALIVCGVWSVGHSPGSGASVVQSR